MPADVAFQSVDLRTADKFFRTELYFGMDRKGGGEVTPEQWTKFLLDEVTPRFPDGLTVFDAAGQFRSASGAIVKEKSRVIVLLYRRDQRKTASQKIDEIRAAYCRRFDQESVMRIDFRRSVEVSFE
jgi:hypothetical protein